MGIPRLKAVESGASDEEVEEQFTMQLEQIIKQCDDELGLIPKMAEWKPWDVPAGHKVPHHPPLHIHAHFAHVATAKCSHPHFEGLSEYLAGGSHRPEACCILQQKSLCGSLWELCGWLPVAQR